MAVCVHACNPNVAIPSFYHWLELHPIISIIHKRHDTGANLVFPYTCADIAFIILYGGDYIPLDLFYTDNVLDCRVRHTWSVTYPQRSYNVRLYQFILAVMINPELWFIHD